MVAMYNYQIETLIARIKESEHKNSEKSGI